MNIDKRLWIISEKISMSMLTNPRTHTPDGICLKVEWDLLGFMLLSS